jgi:polyisoprenoid-binding protein YceI
MAAEKVQFNRYLFDKIQIRGKTNVNDFYMRYSDDEFCKLPNTLNAENSTLGINIPANKIKADSKMMLNDFLDLINADKYPTIDIEIAREEIESSPTEEPGYKNIELTMNGVTKQYRCKTYSESCYANQWCLTGQLEIRLTDFGIEPPNKFLGLIKVKDEIFVNFRILFS